MKRHFTTSVFIIDSEKHVLLIWHKRLQRWMPPGGHIDPDETPEAAAMRECKEETGIDVDIIGDAQPDLFADYPHEGRLLKKPFAMLLEYIPAHEGRNEPAHEHMDFVFLARPTNEDQVLSMNEEEAEDMKWFSLKEIDLLDDSMMYANVRNHARIILA
jgi:8-oxo-dGTP pyrophosphatase MutT (NUDIX family)